MRKKTSSQRHDGRPHGSPTGAGDLERDLLFKNVNLTIELFLQSPPPWMQSYKRQHGETGKDKDTGNEVNGESGSAPNTSTTKEYHRTKEPDTPIPRRLLAYFYFWLRAASQTSLGSV